MRKDRIVLNSCANCKHCYKNYEQDGGIKYFCNMDNEECSGYFYPYYKEGITYEEADMWCEDHAVQPNEICDDFEKLD